MKLTIGMATYKDFEGVWSTVQALRMYQDLTDTEIIVVDNYGCRLTKEYLHNWAGEVRYVECRGQNSTSIPRDRVFKEAKGEAVVVMDSHILLEPGTVKRIREFYESQGPDNPHLYTGPMLYDDLKTVSTHFSPVWSGEMWGVWATDKRANQEQPFEVWGNGLGLFSCRKDAWLGFNPHHRGFGGEEGYIHEKYRKAGHRVFCLPWLKWNHRFGRTQGTPYPLNDNDKYRNYLLGLRELGIPTDEMDNHFRDRILPEVWEKINKEADSLYPKRDLKKLWDVLDDLTEDERELVLQKLLRNEKQPKKKSQSDSITLEAGQPPIPINTCNPSEAEILREYEDFRPLTQDELQRLLREQNAK